MTGYTSELVENNHSSVSENQLKRFLNTQKIAFQHNPLPSLEFRRSLLKKLKSALRKYSDQLISAVSEDFSNRSFAETKVAEIINCIDTIDYTSKRLHKWMRPSHRKLSWQLKPAKAQVLYQPLGVVGIIAPWNYPILLALDPLIGALSAGNRVMIKMSEYTPNTAQAIKELIEITFDSEWVTVVTGDSTMGAEFSALPFDHLLFTGSTQVGRHVMKAAAANLTPVTLELGGKSPVIIAKDTSISMAAERVAFGKCLNAGQTCTAPDYVLCPEDKIEEFIMQFKQCVQKMYPTLLENPDYTSLISDRHKVRLDSYLADAQVKGANIISLAPANEDFTASQKMPVTLVHVTSAQAVNKDMLLMQEEIFGPILPVIAYDALTDAVQFVNQRPRPLALYFFSQNKTEIDYVLGSTHSGGVCINDTMSHVIVHDIPFGGVGASGMGHYHGYEGFLAFSKAKSVYKKGKLNPARFFYPPWNKKIHKWFFDRYLK